jgi:inosine-uridine nucleoside N-ribohydrolase
LVLVGSFKIEAIIGLDLFNLKKSLFKMKNYFILLLLFIAVEILGNQPEKIPVIFDSDINNELDDQHAIAYLLKNQNIFEITGITVNATPSGGEIDKHMQEGVRVLKLMKEYNQIPLLQGANDNFDDIKRNITTNHFDGYEAVNFIINKVNEADTTVTIIAVGKLTNIALAFYKDPSIIKKVQLIWLGSNYPNKGEYNLRSDIGAMNYILDLNVNLEVVVVRYGKTSGSSAVRVTKSTIDKLMPGVGPEIEEPIEGRHGGKFYNFGDYSVNLFKHINYKDDKKSRALFDVVAVAIVKNPEWGEKKYIPAPIMKNEEWIRRSDNPNQIIIWENFDEEKIISDFFQTLTSP